MPDLDIALVQRAASLDPEEGRGLLRTALAELADAAASVPDLVVFPEAFQRDFGSPGSDVSPYAEDLDGPFVATLTELAKEHGCTLVAGMFERSGDPERPFNTLVVVDADGLRTSYRKIHLYDSFGHKESDRLLAGAIEPVLIDVGGVSTGLMTCYDLRFPELARLLVERGAELLLVPAAWVAGPGKVVHWRTLATARAIENTAYVAAVGQPGPRYTGHSMLVSPMGEVVAQSTDDAEALVRGAVSVDRVREAREKNPSLANRRM